MTRLLAALLFTVAAFQMYGLLAAITTIGKPRAPLTGGVAAATVLASFVIIAADVTAGVVIVQGAA